MFVASERLSLCSWLPVVEGCAYMCISITVYLYISTQQLKMGWMCLSFSAAGDEVKRMRKQP